MLSDTHGLLRAEALAELEGVDLILHAGDVGSEDIIPSLEGLAPVTAVRGNVDRGAWARGLTRTEIIPVGDLLIYMLHDRSALDLDPSAAGIALVISGHSHRSSIEEVKGVLYLNPGSAGPRSFGKPVSVARIAVEGENLSAEVVRLQV